MLGAAARNLNVAFLVGLAFAVAASANLPTILFSLYWKRFNTVGAVTGILVGLLSCLILVAIGPTVIGPMGLWAKGVDRIFPLENPASSRSRSASPRPGSGRCCRASQRRRRPSRRCGRAFTGVGAEEAEALAPARARARA